MARLLFEAFARALDTDGDPISGAKLYVYEAGTTTPVDTYSDSSLSTIQAKPVVADAEGYFPQIYVAAGFYKITVKDADDATVQEHDDVNQNDETQRFDDVDAFLASSKSAPAGTIFETRSEGFAYSAVAASTATTVSNAGGQAFNVLLKEGFYDAAAFGADEDASDNTAALQKAFDAWVLRLEAGLPCGLKISGQYTFTSPILVSISSNVNAGGVLDMTGGQLISNLSAAGVAFEMRTRADVRNITWYNFNVEPSSNDTITVLIDAGTRTATPSQFLYNFICYSPLVDGAPNIAWKMTGNFFESALYSPFFFCDNAAGTGDYACWLEDTATDNPSSIDIYGGAMRRGQHALFSDGVSDVKVFGGTYLEGTQECIRMDDNVAGGLYGVHVENAYVGGSGSNLAGALLNNSGFAHGVYGTSDGTGAMDTTLSVFAVGQGISIDGIFRSGDTTQSVFVKAASTAVNIRGVSRSRIGFATVNEQRVAGIETQGRVKRDATASGTIALDMDDQDWFDAILTGNVTISAPTNGVAGDELTVTLKQDGTGGRTVTWSAVFIVATALDATADLYTTWRFRFTGAAWVEQSAAAGV